MGEGTVGTPPTATASLPSVWKVKSVDSLAVEIPGEIFPGQHPLESERGQCVTHEHNNYLVTYFYSTLCCRPLCQTLLDRRDLGLFLFHWSMCLFLRQCQAVLFTVSL